MRVSVQLQRIQGVKISKKELEVQPWVQGSLESCLIGAHEKFLCCDLMASLPNGAPRSILPALRDVKLVMIGGDLIQMRGVELLENGQAVVQEWRCRLCE